jgi:hypothetical protein
MTNNVNVLAPFGPRIARLKIPKNLINKINKEIDRIVDSQNLSKKFDYSKELVGQVSQELQLPKAFINKYLKNFLFKITKSYIEKSLNKKITKLNTKPIANATLIAFIPYLISSSLNNFGNKTPNKQSVIITILSIKIRLLVFITFIFI